MATPESPPGRPTLEAYFPRDVDGKVVPYVIPLGEHLLALRDHRILALKNRGALPATRVRPRSRIEFTYAGESFQAEGRTLGVVQTGRYVFEAPGGREIVSEFDLGDFDTVLCVSCVFGNLYRSRPKDGGVCKALLGGVRDPDPEILVVEEDDDAFPISGDPLPECLLARHATRVDEADARAEDFEVLIPEEEVERARALCEAADRDRNQEAVLIGYTRGLRPLERPGPRGARLGAVVDLIEAVETTGSSEVDAYVEAEALQAAVARHPDLVPLVRFHSHVGRALVAGGGNGGAPAAAGAKGGGNGAAAAETPACASDKARSGFLSPVDLRSSLWNWLCPHHLQGVFTTGLDGGVGEALALFGFDGTGLNLRRRSYLLIGANGRRGG